MTDKIIIQTPLQILSLPLYSNDKAEVSDKASRLKQEAELQPHQNFLIVQIRQSKMNREDFVPGSYLGPGTDTQKDNDVSQDALNLPESQN